MVVCLHVALQEAADLIGSPCPPSEVNWVPACTWCREDVYSLFVSVGLDSTGAASISAPTPPADSLHLHLLFSAALDYRLFSSLSSATVLFFTY